MINLQIHFREKIRPQNEKGDHMIKLALVLSFMCNLCFSSINLESFKNINENETCVDEYIKRDTQLKKWLFWSPPLAVVATPVAFVGGVAVGSVLSNVAGVSGWAQLGVALGGGMILSGLTAVSGVTVEVVTAIKFNRNRTMLKAIVESRGSNLLGKNVNRLTRKFNRKYNKSLTVSDMSKTLIELDQSGELCDGRLKSKVKSSKLKHILAKREDLFNYLN